MNYLLCVIATILLGLGFVCQKKYQLSCGSDFSAAMLYNELYGVFTSISFFALLGFRLQFTSFSVISALLQTVFCVLYMLLGFKIIKVGKLSVYTLFLVSGGMTVPYIYGLVFLHEKATALGVIGLLLILCGMIIVNGSRVKGKYLFLCISVFFLNGMVSVISKLHQIETVHPTGL